MTEPSRLKFSRRAPSLLSAGCCSLPLDSQFAKCGGSSDRSRYDPRRVLPALTTRQQLQRLAQQRRPSLPETKLEPPPLPAAAAAPESQADEAVIERLRAKIPTIPRIENGRLAESADLSHALRETAGLDENVAEVKGVAAVARAANGAASPVRSMPRMDLKPRLATAAPDKAKASVFNTFWPAAPRGDKGGAQGPAAASAPQQEARSAPQYAQPAVAPAATHTRQRQCPSSNQVSSRGWPTRSIPTDRLRRNSRRAHCASAQLARFATTSRTRPNDLAPSTDFAT